MAYDVFVIHHDGSGVRSHIDQDATAALLHWRQHRIGKCKGREINLCKFHSRYVKAGIELLVVAFALQYVEEIAVKA